VTGSTGISAVDYQLVLENADVLTQIPTTQSNTLQHQSTTNLDGAHPDDIIEEGIELGLIVPFWFRHRQNRDRLDPEPQAS
jgi:hypothetical protein